MKRLLPFAAALVAACDLFSFGRAPETLPTAAPAATAPSEATAPADEAEQVPTDEAEQALTGLKFGCRQMRRPAVVDTTRRIDMVDFSFLPPAAADWCVVERTAERTLLVKHALSGKLLRRTPTRPELAHRFVALAVEADTGAAQVSAVEDLRSFIESWLEAGAGMDRHTGRAVLHLEPAARLTHVESEVSADPLLPDTCVVYAAVIEERQHKDLPNAVVQSRDTGTVCLDPAIPGSVAMLIFSEQSVKGQPLDPDLYEAMRREAEPFLRSLEFSTS